MQKDLLAESIKKANYLGRKALIPFLPAGFPDKKRFWDIILELDSCGADVIEIGIPFSDPLADGPVVEEASQHCLGQGVNLSWLLQGLSKLSPCIRSEIVLMGYVNPFLQYGWARLAQDAATCGVRGLIVPDLPLEESGDWETILTEKDLVLIRLIGLNTPVSRMRLYAERASGFIYFVSVLGTTGTKKTLSPSLTQALTMARENFRLPIALGFGLSSPDQIQGQEKLIDAVVFGSSLIQHIKSGYKISRFMDLWTR